jgi:uncharacterized membrane protein YphA (DoxX/SURF4 family)
MAGAALLVFRVSVATTLLVDGTENWAIVTSFWTAAIFLVPAIFLCVGLLTPYAAALSCLLQLGVLMLSRGQNDFHLSLSTVSTVILAVLGPGAYSIDARLFGRRLLSLSQPK